MISNRDSASTSDLIGSERMRTTIPRHFPEGFTRGVRGSWLCQARALRGESPSLSRGYAGAGYARPAPLSGESPSLSRVLQLRAPAFASAFRRRVEEAP